MSILDNEQMFENLNFPDAPAIKEPVPGPKAEKMLARQARVDSQVLTYPNMIPLVPAVGLGATLKDVDGNCFIDMSGGVGVLNLGHSHPEVVKAIKAQSEIMVHALDFPGEARLQMSEKLVEIAPQGLKNNCKTFMCGPTGSDAVESAVKLAKFITKKPGVIAFEGGWHGVSGTGLAATGKKGVRQSFLPVVPEITHVPFPYCYRCAFGKSQPDCDLQCAKFLEHAVRDPDGAATSPGCVLIEPIQGEGGIVVPPEGFLQEIRRICDDYGLIMIMDEIQTGFGRTGAMFASDLYGITPDILCISKTMGGGLPLAAILIRSDLDQWGSGAHVGTFRGNLLASAAGLATIKYMEETDLPERSARLGKIALDRLKQIAQKSRTMGDVRGQGLFIGIEFVEDKVSKIPNPDILQKAVSKCFEKGLMLWKAGRYNNIGRLMPALVITEKLLNQGIDIFEKALMEIENQ